MRFCRQDTGFLPALTTLLAATNAPNLKFSFFRLPSDFGMILASMSSALDSKRVLNRLRIQIRDDCLRMPEVFRNPHHRLLVPETINCFDLQDTLDFLHEISVLQ